MVAVMPEHRAEEIAWIVEQQPIGRLGRAEEAAAAAVWPWSPAASVVVGAALPVVGGHTTD